MVFFFWAGGGWWVWADEVSPLTDEASPPANEASPFGQYIFTKFGPSFLPVFSCPKRYNNAIMMST